MRLVESLHHREQIPREPMGFLGLTVFDECGELPGEGTQGVGMPWAEKRSNRT